MRTRSSPRFGRRTGPWLVLFLVLTLLAGAAGLVLKQKLNGDIQMARQRAQRELQLISTFIGNALQAGRYQDAEALLREWGEANPVIIELQLFARNGFVIGAFQRPGAYRGSYTVEAPLSYSYKGQAQLRLSVAMDEVYQRHTELTVELLSIFGVFALLLVGLTYLTLHSRQTAALLRLRSQEASALGAAVQLSEAQLLLALRAGKMGTFDWDLGRDKITWSEQHAEIFGMQLRDFDGSYASFVRSVHPDDLPYLEQAVKRAQLEHGFYQAEFRIIWPDGSQHWVAAQGEFFYDAAGVAQRMAGLTMDISARKQAHLALQESERQFRTLLENMQLVGVILDQHGDILLCNDYLLRLTGWQREEVLHRNWFDVFLPGETRHEIKHAVFLEAIRTNNVPVNYENEIVTRQGERRLIAWNNTLLKGSSTHALTIASIGEDITDRKAAERALKLSEEHFRSLFEQASDGIFIANAQSRFVDVNSFACRMLGYSRAELLWMDVVDILAPAEHARLAQEFTRRPTGEEMRDEWRFRRKNNSQFIGEVSAKWLANGYLQVFLRDVTARKNDEARLLEEIQKRRLLLDSAEDGIFVLDQAFHLMEANPSFAKMLGRTLEETLRLQPWDWDASFPTEALWRAHWPELPKTQQRFETKLLKPSGATFEVEISGSPALTQSGEALMLFICTDVTQRKRAEQAIQRSERHLHDVINSLFVYVGVLTPGGIVTEVNEPPLALAGLQAGDVIGKAFPDCYWWSYSAEVQTRLWSAIQRAAAGEPVRYDERARMGEKYIIVDLGLIPLRDEAGNVTHIIPSGVDITERKRVEGELRQLTTQLEQRVAARTAELADKHRELESFTYSVAHDLKAPLRGIDGYSRLLLSDYAQTLDEQGQLFIGSIRNATEHMAQLIDDLLAYSRIERRDLQCGELSLVGLVQRLLQERKADIEADHIALSVQLECDTIYGEAEGLSLAIRNLMDNAIKFTGGVAQPRIEIKAVKQWDQCLFSVSDNGPGFDMRYHDRIFEIFQRLHRAEEFPGTGIGLAIVRKSMQRMGGRAWAESEIGKGATFFLELPITKDAHASRP